MTRGTYRNAYPAPAAAHSPRGCLRTGFLRRGWRAEVTAPDPGGEARKCQRGDSQHNRQHAAERPVTRLQELLLDDVADQAVLRATQNVGDREDAECGNEHQRGTGVY